MKKFRKMSIQFNYNYPQLAREAGFRLRQYKDGPVDWRLLGSYEIERLLRDQNIEDIDKALLHLSEAPLGSVLLDTNILDPAIAKYFIVSQFAIQYLLFCRNFLDETVQELRESHAESQMELAHQKKLLSEANNEILQLHKKMTQMEAIHEVIYPCHLCTKNFANNEALNIHIGRKHSKSKNQNSEHRTETPVSASKERNMDLTLINTIKLELEIKQLKERLNNTEKEIRERQSRSDLGKNNDTGGGGDVKVQQTNTETRNVAIQSNLSEEKEKNDSNEEYIEESRIIEERKAQLEKLQIKIYEMEEWRATQMANNEDSIAEINRKLTDIAQALERTGDGKKNTPCETENHADMSDREHQRRLSVEDLERVLSEKLAEIGKASSDKLEAIVQNMETSYREKLFQLELELKKTQHDIQINDREEITRPKYKQESIQTKVRKVRKAEDHDDVSDDGTYNIEIAKETDLDVAKPKASTSQSTEVNRTFVKKLQVEQKTVLIQDEEALSDVTNISESLSDDAAVPSNAEIEKPAAAETAIKIETREKPVTLKAKSPRRFTRKDAKNLAAKRLSKYGFDMHAKSISNGAFKRINAELNEKRRKLKQQYPNFYATRNRIKNFVDKLCTTKSNEKAERMLTTTATLQPMKIPKRLEKQLISRNDIEVGATAYQDRTEDHDDVDDDDDDEDLEKITKEKIATSEDFKKRLERLLASPVKRPGVNIKPTNTIVQVHSEFRDARPFPMPRKRVMFNTTVGKPTDSGDITELK